VVLRLAIVAVLACARSAAAQAPDDAPWAKGVADDRKAAARKLLDEGNELFVRDKHRDALAKYQDAIAIWDHPAIRFNIVRALIALDRPLDAYDNLDKALAYGKPPLGDAVYAEALNYRRLLDAQIGALDVSCKQDGVAIALDGKPLLACPGAHKMRVVPGNHVVVATKPGFLTATDTVVVLPASTRTLAIELRSIAQAAVTRTRWTPWKPWAVAGGGAALAGAGALLAIKASSDLDSYRQSVAALCATTGCTAQQQHDFGLDGRRSTALAENKVAIGAMIVGGAAVAAGVALVISNRPHSYVPEVAPTQGGVALVVHGAF
jgi:hypothetical protein